VHRVALLETHHCSCIPVLPWIRRPKKHGTYVPEMDGIIKEVA
jgi:hypothetical protein